MDQRFMVGILSVTPETVRVSFPMNHFPAPGMRVELEFHDAQGYTSYESEVIETPATVGDGLLLVHPTGNEPEPAPHLLAGRYGYSGSPQGSRAPPAVSKRRFSISARAVC